MSKAESDKSRRERTKTAIEGDKRAINYKEQMWSCRSEEIRPMTHIAQITALTPVDF